MSYFESIPPELFQEIGSRLAFFDKKALSITSKKCHDLLGPFKCVDRLSWMVYLCNLAPDFSEYIEALHRHGFDLLVALSLLDAHLMRHYAHFGNHAWFFDDLIEDRLWEGASLVTDGEWAEDLPRRSRDDLPENVLVLDGTLDKTPWDRYFVDEPDPFSSLAYFYLKRLRDYCLLDAESQSSGAKFKQRWWEYIHYVLEKRLVRMQMLENKDHDLAVKGFETHNSLSPEAIADYQTKKMAFFGKD